MGAFKGWQSTLRNRLFAKFPNIAFPSIINALLLQQIPNASLAFSVRLINANYIGPCMKVRRSSDNTTQDIYFVGLNLDTASLLSFCAGSSGFVEIWYDQSGNGNNAIQNINNAFQPRIVNAGVTETLNGKPALFFDGSNDYMFYNNVSSAQPTSIIILCKRTASSTLGFVGFSSDPVGPIGAIFATWIYSDNILYTVSPNRSAYFAFNNNNRLILASFPQSTTIPVYYNNIQAAATEGAASTNPNYGYLNKRNAEYGLAYVQECLLYNQALQSLHNQFLSNINSYFSVF